MNTETYHQYVHAQETGIGRDTRCCLEEDFHPLGHLGGKLCTGSLMTARPIQRSDPWVSLQ